VILYFYTFGSAFLKNCRVDKNAFSNCRQVDTFLKTDYFKSSKAILNGPFSYLSAMNHMQSFTLLESQTTFV
jgi:hypothetical protein